MSASSGAFGAAEPGRLGRPERPARSYRELSHQILVLASQAANTRAFVGDSLRLLAGFTACDLLQLWIRRGRRRFVGWSFDPEDGRLELLGGTVVPRDADPAQHLESWGSPRILSQLGLPLEFGAKVDGWLLLGSRQPEFFPEVKRELYADIALTLGAAVAYQRAQVAHRERVKELSCLYQIARLAAEPGLSRDAILEGIVEILPPAWQYAEVAAARIRVDDREFSTPGFDDAVHRMQAPIYIDNHERGRVEVAYVEERAAIDHGPFLEEEQSLIEAVAREVGRIWGQQQAELERQRLQEQLRHADRLATIGQLAAGVAHELNEPLGSILGFAQLGRKTPDLPAQLDRDLERIEGAALHSREVVRKLNLFARQTPTRQEGFDLTRAVRDGMFLLESRCRKEGIDLQFELADDLGLVRGDSGQITQVLMNLVVNALQAMEDGGILHIATFREEDQACLQVADTGGGIPAEVCARIFEPFFTTKDVGEGTGLGLSVVHGIVSAHGGRIEVQSDTGRGTTFTVRLPIREDAGPSGAPAPDSG